MRRHLTSFKLRLICLVAAIQVIFICSAFDFTTEKDIEEINVWDLDLEENISYPQIPVSISNDIAEYIGNQYKKLKKQGYNVSLVRNGQVIKIQIPTDNFFDINSIILNEKICSIYLSGIINTFLQIKDFYRVIFSMHHDNSLGGDEAEELTYERVLSIVEWSQKKHQNAKYIIPYSMGNDELLTSDKSKKGQKMNRRLEIYIIPGKLMIELATENKL